MKVPKRLKPYMHVTLLQIIKMFTSISKLHYSLTRANKNMLMKYEMILFHFTVRPRLYSQEPKAVEVGKDSIQLSWRPAELPQFARHKLPIRYMVEMKTLPSSHWEPLARNVHDTSYLVKGLRSDKEYQFRIKALTDFGNSEPSLPVTVYRKSGTI